MIAQSLFLAGTTLCATLLFLFAHYSRAFKRRKKDQKALEIQALKDHARRVRL